MALSSDRPNSLGIHHMDDSRFDALARSLVSVGSRRHALGGFLASVLALVGSRTDEVSAKNCKKIQNKAKRKKCLAKAKTLSCPAGQRPCRGACLSVLICCDDTDCAGGGPASRGRAPVRPTSRTTTARAARSASSAARWMIAGRTPASTGRCARTGSVSAPAPARGAVRVIAAFQAYAVRAVPTASALRHRSARLTADFLRPIVAAFPTDVMSMANRSACPQAVQTSALPLATSPASPRRDSRAAPGKGPSSVLS
jgi:hypothetical protein